MRKIECSTQDDVDAAVAIGDIAVVRAGEFSVGGSAVVRASGKAVVYDRGSAAVYDRITKAPLRRRRPRAVIAPIGSRDDSLGASLPDDGSDPYVYAGCWHGTLSEFEARIAEVYIRPGNTATSTALRSRSFARWRRSRRGDPMSARRLTSVPPSPPPLRPATAVDAARAHPHNPEHQRRWLAAIRVLRTTRGGRILDRPTGRK